MGRLMGLPSSDRDKHRRSGRDAMSHAGWEFSLAVGRVALGLVCLALIVTVVRHIPSVSDSLVKVLPQPIADFLRDEKRTPPPQGNKIEELRSRVTGSVFDDSKSARTEARSRSDPRSFGMGSTKEDVAALQGTPTRRTDSTWVYGESEVYFAGDRVIGWRNSTANPLRVQ